MLKYFFLFVLFLCLGGYSFAQPDGALAPKERDIEEVPEDSVSAAVYIGMSYEELMAVFNNLKNYSEGEPIADLQKKEKELRKIRDMAWRLVQFMADPIKKRVAESAGKESDRVKLLKAVNAMQEEQADFSAEREKRKNLLDSLDRQESEEATEDSTATPTESTEEEIIDEDGDGWADDVPKNQAEKKKKKVKNTKGMTKEQKEKLRQEGEAEKKRQAEEDKKKKQQKEKEKEAERLKKQEEKAIEKQIKEDEKFLEESEEYAQQLSDSLSFMEDSLARYTSEIKAFEDSTELLRKQLKPVKGLAFEIRKAWVKLNYMIIDKTDNLGKEAALDFEALINDFHNSKDATVIKSFEDTGLIERVKALRDNIFYSKKTPNLNCRGGVGNFMKYETRQSAPTDEQKAFQEELNKIWEDIGRGIWQLTDKNKAKTREVSAQEYQSIGRNAGCVGYVLGLGDDCNLVFLKLNDDSKLAILCRKNKEDQAGMGAIKIIK
jgi:chemotaxis protein histidine kinase CheA